MGFSKCLPLPNHHQNLFLVLPRFSFSSNLHPFCSLRCPSCTLSFLTQLHAQISCHCSCHLRLIRFPLLNLSNEFLNAINQVPLTSHPIKTEFNPNFPSGILGAYKNQWRPVSYTSHLILPISADHELFRNLLPTLASRILKLPVSYSLPRLLGSSSPSHSANVIP